MPTKYQYTGQYSYASGTTGDFGLLYFNARWYDSALSLFVQADTLVPDLYNTLDWNRYGYARNNSLRYADPSGHDPQCILALDDQCVQMSGGKKIPASTIQSNSWTEDDGYDPETDSIPDWGVNWAATYMERAAKVWGWMCSGSGWWGTGCPTIYNLTVWLIVLASGINGDVCPE